MFKKEESTQNLKTEIGRTNFWEESLPLPDQEYVTLPKLGQPETKVQPKEQILFEKPEVPLPQPSVTQTPKKARFLRIRLPKLKIILVLPVLAFSGVTIGLVFNFLVLPKQDKKTILPTPAPTKKTFKRISSAFVPKIPSTEAGNLSVNWKKFEDTQAGFSFFHPEEWQFSENDSSAIHTLYYPVFIENNEASENFIAKLSITEEKLQEELVKFLTKRYNLFNVNLEQQTVGGAITYQFKIDNTFVFAISSQTRLFILEGKVVEKEDLENFLPIFLNISYSFQILK